MRTITVSEGQSMIDVAMQHCGDASRVFDIAELNSLNVTDELAPGQALLVPDAENDKVHVVSMFKELKHEPASIGEYVESDDEGIGYWEIGNDFIIGG